MSNTREELLLAAGLAKLMSGELSQVDQLTVESNPGRRANQIDMNQFVAPLLNRPVGTVPKNFSYIPEEMVQSMVPDTSIGSRPAPPALIELPKGYQAPPHLPVQPLGPTKQLPPQANNPISIGMDDITKGNIASIANNLVLLRKDFAKIFGPLLTFLRDQNPNKTADTQAPKETTEPVQKGTKKKE